MAAITRKNQYLALRILPPLLDVICLLLFIYMVRQYGWGAAGIAFLFGTFARAGGQIKSLEESLKLRGLLEQSVGLVEKIVDLRKPGSAVKPPSPRPDSPAAA